MSQNGDYSFVDADGHIVEHPTRLWELAPSKYKDQVFRIEARPDGSEVQHWLGQTASSSAGAGVAGMSREQREAAFRGELRYTQMVPGAYEPGPRLEAMNLDRIDQSVLYPTILLGLASVPDLELATVMARGYNEWILEFCKAEPRRLFAVAAVPQQDLATCVKEIYRARDQGFVGVFLRPNPSIEGRYFHDPMYEPLWNALEDTGLPLGLHPYLAEDLPGACRALGLSKITGTTAAMLGDRAENLGNLTRFGSVVYTQAVANPFDMMLSMTFLLMGGVCERHPSLKLLFLEANGGWVVPWLERLDHHAEIFRWDVPGLKMKPSDYFRRQGWISFDTDEHTLQFTANDKLVGADRIIWASDFPHPDAKYPGTVKELIENTQSLTDAQKTRIYGENARELYGLPKLAVRGGKAAR
jgi:predicted TIM-barrel fold metal-dependent hydrolase